MPGRRTNNRRRPKKRGSDVSSIDRSHESISDLTALSSEPEGLTSSPVEEVNGAFPSLRLQNVCRACEKLYDQEIANLQFSSNSNSSIYLGNLQHISPDTGCIMCLFFHGMKSDYSETNDYHLHAFSAATSLFATPMRDLIDESVITSKTSYKDAPLFGVIAGAPNQISVTDAYEILKHRGCFLSCNLDYFGREIPHRHNESGIYSGSAEDEKHLSIIRWRPNVTKYQSFIYPLPETVSIEDAIDLSRAKGFVTISNNRALPEHLTTKDLEKRQKSSSGLGGPITLWPVRIATTEDNDTPGQRGYVPHSIRRKLYIRSLYGRTIDVDRVDFNLIRTWIDECLNRQKRPNRCEEFTGQRTRLKKLDLYLLDCKTRRVIQPESKKNLEYVALSYVWGNISRDLKPMVHKIPYSIPDSCCAVIEDAISVALRLGFRYLWIDMLCISSASSLRHDQIGHMDTVYKNAALTIVAAAGFNAEYGLPGVGQRPRIKQSKIYIKNHRFVSTLPHPEHTLDRSVYQTRAWTYQEFFFSTRRLIFTDHQVHFQCQSRCRSNFRCESLSFPPFSELYFKSLGNDGRYQDHLPKDKYLQGVHALIKDTRYFIDGTLHVANNSGIRKLSTLAIFEHHINQFSNRKLSFDSDALAAIVSVLDRFPHEIHSIQHLAGIPFMSYAKTYTVVPWPNASPISHKFNFAYDTIFMLAFIFYHPRSKVSRLYIFIRHVTRYLVWRKPVMSGSSGLL
ncbi:HET-domain-containing protein [Microthyrium microscopicum]|uniref:HET-domain-containing protein n=1 Tax=Microthyrium microscopicum TaxID=703497 RepID=A0A6A6UBW1_9PEZI|nr:HET-domain-containing protein [Microthyrium microscopicum]